MGELTARRFMSLALLLFACAQLSGCSPVYTIARDLIEASREQHEAASLPTPARMAGVEAYLDGRFRPLLKRAFPNSPIGYARCPQLPDEGGIEIARCSITAGSLTIPILTQNNPADRHLNSTLAMSLLPVAALEKNVERRIEAEYGVSALVRCTGPALRLSIPNTYISCNLRSRNSVGDTVRVFVIDTADWVSLEAKREPPDEVALRAAYAKDGGRRIPGMLVERIIRRRGQLMPFGSKPALSSIKCPRFMNLANERRVYCEIEAGQNEILERVAFIHDRLAFRMGGAYVPLEYVRRIAGRPVNCAQQYFVFVPPSGYHWCEIPGVTKYPKRLVITAMDKDGHYDMFFSNFSQSAFAH